MVQSVKHHRLAVAFLAAVLLLNLTPAVNSLAADNESPWLNMPIPVNHGAKGVKLPYFDAKGKLQMDFSIDSAYRVDNDHLQMKMVKMQTYDEDGKPEMLISLTSSVLDLATQIVSSDEPVTIRRSDFELTGDTMQFNTQTKSGKIVGKVRMLIFNVNNNIPGKGAQ